MAAKKTWHARSPHTRQNCLTLFEYRDGTEFIVFDTETTGIRDTDTIVELAALRCRVSGKKASVVEVLDLFIRPPVPMDEKVVAVHGITNEFLDGMPPEEDVFPRIREFFGNRPILVGHNVGFDEKMLSSLYRRNGASLSFQIGLDTLEMARDLFEGKETESYSLQDLAGAAGLDAGLSFHHAMDDVKATLRLLSFCYQEYREQPDPPENLTELYIRYLYFRKGYNKYQTGVCVVTDYGTVCYSNFRKRWVSSEVDLDTVDIARLETDVLVRTGIPDMAEFGRMTEKKFEAVKKQMRASR